MIRRRANIISLLLRHSWTKYHIYSTKSAKYLHNYILNCRFDAAMNYRCPGCYKIEDFITTYIWCTKRIYTIMYPVGCRPIAYAESYRRIIIIVLVDTIHVRQSLEMRLLTSTYSTVITTKNIVDINIILRTSQYSRSKQDNIQQSTYGVWELILPKFELWCWSIGMLGYHWMIKVVIRWISHNNIHTI